MLGMNAEVWAQIKKLMAIERLSLTEIGRRVGLDRKTVRRALLSETLPVTHLSRPRPSKLDPYKGWIQERIQEYPRLCGEVVLRD